MVLSGEIASLVCLFGGDCGMVCWCVLWIHCAGYIGKGKRFAWFVLVGIIGEIWGCCGLVGGRFIWRECFGGVGYVAELVANLFEKIIDKIFGKIKQLPLPLIYGRK